MSQKRSRLGCITCRRKHRKCDEQRPCTACVSKGHECVYQNRIKWIPPSSVRCLDKRPSRGDRERVQPSDGATQQLAISETEHRISPTVDSLLCSRNEPASDSKNRTPDSAFPPALTINNTSEASTGLSSNKRDHVFVSTLRQILESPEEEAAYHFYLDRVCAIIPAHDGPRNPYRRLAIVAQAHPVLLQGIISVSTGFMFSSGLCDEEVLTTRQSRALTLLQAGIGAVRDGSNKDVAPNFQRISNASESGRGVFSILSEQDIVLASVMMQTSSALMTGIGNVEMHLRCAWLFIQDLGYLHHHPRTALPWIWIFRFAQVDVLLALLRFRRPMAPLDFFMYQTNEHLDHGDPSFLEMQGCPQRVICFLARIGHLSVEIEDGASSPAEVQSRAFKLEIEMRIWGQRYHDAVGKVTSSEEQRANHDARNLELVCECFYWICHLLLMRRVYFDPPSSSRVQMVRRHMFELMAGVTPGCGPDTSLPFPFYMAAREAITNEDRDWVRRRYADMKAIYRHRARQFMMDAVERIWTFNDNVETTSETELHPWQTPIERFVRDMDKEATYVMF